MDKSRTTTTVGALIIAIVLLLLPILYVGSYLALVQTPTPFISWVPENTGMMASYRAGGNTATRFFWPLEQVDRKVRPGMWDVRLQTR